MDDPQNSPQAGGLPQGPHFAANLPGLTPLRLSLQPSGMIVELTAPDVLCGRHTDADFRLPLPDVSRHHCRFQFVNGTWQVVDLKSLNGVYVNEERVEKAALRQNDQVRLGGFTFVVDLQTAAKEEVGAEPLADALFKSRVRSLPFLPQRKAS
jgi:pSer/pThr/pTyr-binding forkhead associated (FHA) protein